MNLRLSAHHASLVLRTKRVRLGKIVELENSPNFLKKKHRITDERIHISVFLCFLGVLRPRDTTHYDHVHMTRLSIYPSRCHNRLRYGPLAFSIYYVFSDARLYSIRTIRLRHVRKHHAVFSILLPAPVSSKLYNAL